MFVRDSGFYFIKLNNEPNNWTIGFYEKFENKWRVIGVNCCLYENNQIVIISKT